MVGGKVAEGPLKTASTPERMVPMDAELERALRLTRERTVLVAGNVTSITAAAGAHVAVDAAGEALHPGWYAREFQRVAQGLELPALRLHDVRHTAASIMVRAGLPPAEVAAILGHSVEVLLGTYSHADEDETRAVMDSYSGAILAR